MKTMYMLVNLAVLVLISSVSSQYTCECGLFLPAQFDGPNSVNALPLDANSTTGADVTSCTTDTAGNPCAQFCAGVLDTIIADNDLNFCAQPDRNVNLCRGGGYCAKLQNEGVGGVTDEYLYMYYRVPACAGQGGVHEGEWTQASSTTTQEALCCQTDFPYFEDCFGGETCECVSEAGTYCECAIFVPEQLSPPQVRPGQLPRPLDYISGSLNDTEPDDFCLNAGVSGEDPCIDTCQAAAQAYFASFDLTSNPPSDQSRTYGELYCQSFKARWPSFNQPLTTTLDAYINTPTCPVVGWLLVPNSQHGQQLCCNADGSHNPTCA